MFKTTPDGTTLVLHAFLGRDEAGDPEGNLLIDPAGNVFGTTTYGGGGNGIVFELSPPADNASSWTETVIHVFTTDGSTPSSGLILGPDGAFYGVTKFGGIYGEGVVYMLVAPWAGNAAWTEQVIHSFGASNDGIEPQTGLYSDNTGNLYGTAAGGPAYAIGLVYKLVRPTVQGQAWSEQLLYQFDGGRDGESPQSNVVADAGGNLFGTTLYGGIGEPYGNGTLYKLSHPPKGATTWKRSTIYTFGRQPTDGSQPQGNLIIDKRGNLYGTTSSELTTGYGSVFEIQR